MESNKAKEDLFKALDLLGRSLVAQSVTIAECEVFLWRSMTLAALEHAGGDKTNAAKILGIHERRLRFRM